MSTVFPEDPRHLPADTVADAVDGLRNALCMMINDDRSRDGTPARERHDTKMHQISTALRVLRDYQHVLDGSSPEEHDHG